MLRTALIFALFMLTMNGCAGIGYRNDSLQRMQTLPEHYNQFDAKLAWQVTSTGNSTVIDGVVQNIRYQEMNNVEVWVLALDANGKEVHRGVDYAYRMRENEASSYTVKLPRLASGTRLQFIYRYVGFNGDSESADAITWSQSFETKVP